ncbi:acyl-CoA dehydrogenase family protein [Mycobacterium barrassiae]|uniref:acyl-CoA dehydrogenase family protein n=1 Tax=Mycobacterium barrassiae TaxID=319709 RepID=UPI002265C9C1|nr:acyl-CoA dehydrogenase family protein [Mycobacterium barrassiae]MCV7300779.1 acyl-CoA dehydrogenase family protein [Mycobacterium barrassiae]
MRVIPSQDERDLAAMCRSVLAADLEPDAQWKALASAGVLGLVVDGSLGDIGVFCIEAGRALCPTVVQSTVYAALAVDWLGVGSAWLPRLTSGGARGTCALFNPQDASDVTPRVRMRRDGDTWRVSGEVRYVANADQADVIVTTTDGGVVAVDTTANGIDVEALPIMGGFPVFTVRFDDVLVDEPVPVDDDQLRRVANAIVTLDCLDLVGVGEAVIDRTVDYTKMREQFGRPIASFQAAQHIVADMHIALAAARLAAQSATFWIGRGRTATRETAIARIRAAEIKKVTLDAHQLHGGMGYVVDTGLHLFSERARVLSTLGGGADVAAKWLVG